MQVVHAILHRILATMPVINGKESTIVGHETVDKDEAVFHFGSQAFVFLPSHVGHRLGLRDVAQRRKYQFTMLQ